MKKSRFTESQIVFALKQSETGVKVEEVCRKMGISEATFYNWKKKIRRLGHNGTSPLAPAGRREQPTQKAGSGPKFR